MPTPRERWFADVFRAGLETRVLTEQDILSHATPAVLTATLPRDVMVKVIDATLASGTMSHKAIIDIVTIELLAEKVPPNLVWTCIDAVGERAGIRDGIPKDEPSAREFVRRVLEAGLATGAFTAKDIIAQCGAQVLGTSLPETLTTKLLEATLVAGKMNPEIIVETIGVAGLAKHVSTNVLWGIFAKVGTAGGPVVAAPLQKPVERSSIDMDDNVLVELVADAPEPIEVKPAPKAEPKSKAVPETKSIPAKQPTRPG